MRHSAQKLAFPLVAVIFLASVAFAQSPQQSSNPPAQQPTNQPAPIDGPMPASPQAPKPTVPSVIRASSDLVRIDVEVTDKSGKPIKGLRADQFTVTDDGKREEISSFSYSDIEGIESAAAAEDKPIVVPVDNEGPNAPSADAISDQLRDRRLLVLFFDLTSMQSDDLTRAHDAAAKFVKEQMTKADIVAVVAFSSKLIVLANFTNDHATLDKAIPQLTSTSISDLSNPLYAAAENGEYDVQEYTGAAYTPDETEFNVFNTDPKLAAVEGLADVLGGIPGRKAMVEFTGGITQTGGEDP